MGGILEVQLGLVLLRKSRQHAVEDVVVPLVGVLVHDPGFLQKVLLDLGAFDGSGFVEVDVDVLPEPRRVVVANRFRVSES